LNYAILYFLSKYFGLNKIVSETISILITLQYTFFLHDRWTYNDSTQHNRLYTWGIKKRYFSYLATNSIGSISTVVFFGIFSQFMSRLFALGTAALIALIWNFLLNKIIIWRKPSKIGADNVKFTD